MTILPSFLQLNDLFVNSYNTGNKVGIKME